MKIRTHKLALLGVLLLPFFLFQNCSTYLSPSQQKTNGESSSFARDGNGDSYDGKLSGRYHGYDSENPCQQLEADGLPTPNGILEFTNGIATETRSNCVDQTPSLVPEEEYLTSLFNLRIVSFTGLHFQSTKTISSPINFSRYVSNTCRGEIFQSSNNESILVDVVIRTDKNWTNSPPRFTGEIIKASSNSNDPQVSQSQVQPEDLIIQSIDSNGLLSFSRTTGQNPFTLNVGANNQSSFNTTINGEDFSGTIACDFESETDNLLSSSNNFTQSPWYALSGIAAPVGLENNATTAPDGSDSAWRLYDQSGNGLSWLRYLSYATAPGDRKTRTFSVHLKYESSPETQIKIQYNNGGTRISGGYVQIRWANNGTASLIQGPLASDSGLVDLGNGWYRVWVSVQNNGSGNTQAIPAIYPVEPTSGANNLGVYIWGAQLDLGSGMLPYNPK